MGRSAAALPPPRWDEAEEHFAASLRACEEGDSRLEAARTHVTWGKVLGLCGNTDATREHFKKAAAQFDASGLSGELERTKRLIDSISV